MKHALALVAVSLVTSVAAGCAGSTPLLRSDLTPLSGAWNLVSIQPAGQGEQAKPSGASYTVTFADGRLSTRVDCNSCVGGYTVDGQTLVAGPALACTRAACATMGFENAYTKLLSGESSISASGDMLVLTSARGVLRFVR